MSIQDSDLSSIRIRMVFQAGQSEMTVGEVQEIAPGMVLPMHRGEKDIIDILANGKRIGTGELVKVGDTLAVRVTRLNSDA